MQQRLKPAPGITRTEIASPKLLHKLLLTVYDPGASLYLLFGRVALAALTAALERRID
jgi:hypothetical protein